MNFILVRHPETLALKNKIIYGVTESDLTPEGYASIPWAAEKLAKTDPAAIYSSPLSRAYKLAQGICEKHPGMDIVSDERIIEMHCGIYEQMTFEEARMMEGDDAQQYLMEFGFHRPIGGENFEDVKVRTKPFLDEIITKADEYGDKPVIIVSHAMVMRALVSHLTGFGLNDMWHVHIEPTAILSLDYNPAAQFGRIIGFVNPGSEI